ncbi:MAG: transcription antitermination factor NusB [Chitinivibrionales bacterium]|nr:transcription antitermination factor NusB [Chitinivibrionales bacterium]
MACSFVGNRNGRSLYENIGNSESHIICQTTEETMTNRRKSRELALQTLYAAEARRDSSYAHIMKNIADSGDYSPEAREYCLKLLEKVFIHKEQLDSLIQSHAANWDLVRMAAIDRNVMRTAVAELLFFTKIPYKVVIDEAVEIAKEYGTDDSGRFVNGILDSIYKTLSEKGKEVLSHGTDSPSS